MPLLRESSLPALSQLCRKTNVGCMGLSLCEVFGVHLPWLPSAFGGHLGGTNLAVDRWTMAKHCGFVRTWEDLWEDMGHWHIDGTRIWDDTSTWRHRNYAHLHHWLLHFYFCSFCSLLLWPDFLSVLMIEPCLPCMHRKWRILTFVLVAYVSSFTDTKECNLPHTCATLLLYLYVQTRVTLIVV